MREEENVGELERLVYVAMRHKLLIGEALVSFLFFKSGVDLSGDELGGSIDDLGDDDLEMLDQVVKEGASLQWCCHHIP